VSYELSYVEVIIFCFSPETSVICTDGLNVYSKCQTMFEHAEHKVVNHNERYRDKVDLTNHINAVEGQNRWLKRCIKSRREVEYIDDYIDWYAYTTYVLGGSSTSLADKMHLFLQHMAAVYPGKYSGKYKERLRVMEEDTWLPSARDVGISDLPAMRERVRAPAVPDRVPNLQDEDDDCDQVEYSLSERNQQ
jgi:hypothetical protein